MQGFLLAAKNRDIIKYNFCPKGVFGCLMFPAVNRNISVGYGRANLDFHHQENIYSLFDSNTCLV